METWALALMAILLLIAAVIAVLTYIKSGENQRMSATAVLIPFTGTVDDKGVITTKTSTNGSQIDCSKFGGVVNIVGAFMSVVDPYGVCSTASNPLINTSCGIPGGNVTCKSKTDCGEGMTCAGGFCTPAVAVLIPKDSKGQDGYNIDKVNSSCGNNYCPVQPGKPCPSNKDSDCNDPNGDVMKCVSQVCQVRPDRSCMGVNRAYGTCASFPVCSNTGIESNELKSLNVSNKQCIDGKCRTRDVSAYVAGVCDGKDFCQSVWDLTKTDNGLGPLPCGITPNGSDYKKLPIIPGQGGKYNQGYYVHGIYTCIAKN